MIQAKAASPNKKYVLYSMKCILAIKKNQGDLKLAKKFKKIFYRLLTTPMSQCLDKAANLIMESHQYPRFSKESRKVRLVHKKNLSRLGHFI